MTRQSWKSARRHVLALPLSAGLLACSSPPTGETDATDPGLATSGSDGSAAAATSTGGGTSAPTTGGTGNGGVDPTTDGTGTSTTSGAASTASTATGGTDTGDTDTGDTDPGPVFGDPIVVDELETWVWVPIPEMRCADGSSSGLMVNFTAQSRDLMIFFQGGGACWNQLTCLAQPQSLAPWEADPFATWALDGGPVNGGIFDRLNPANPLRSHNFVYVPYCTGDGHLGDKVAAYGVHHVGYANAARALERIVPTFLDATQIVVAGFSAGGMGATGNYHQIADAFESVGRESLVLINDAGPILRPPFLSAATMTMLRDAWGLDTTVAPWCPACVSDGYHNVYRTQVELHPGVRSSLLCSYNDSVVRLLYGALGSPVELGALDLGLRDLAGWRDQIAGEVDPSRLREFYYFGERHGATENIPLADSPGLAEFLTAQLTGDPNWTSVRP